MMEAVSNPDPPEITLSEDQERVMRMVKSGQNVFFTGPAGTGKSLLLKEIKTYLTHRSRKFAVTASTGVAGLNIGGFTLHSFAGVGLAKEPQEVLLEKMLPGSRQRWLSLQTLIIDEISMLDGKLFDKIEYIARQIKKNDAPFGGIQLVLSGDFFQLPPVPDTSFQHTMPSTFVFEAKSWLPCIPKPIFLTQVFRQRDDTFVKILARIRHGTITPEDEICLKGLQRPVVYDDGIESSHLFPRRAEVEACNSSKLAALPGPQRMYYAADFAGFDVHRVPIPIDSAKILLSRLVTPPILALKVGAQVMLTLNLKEDEETKQKALVNGSVGKVTEFLTCHEACVRDIRTIKLPLRGGVTSTYDGAPDPRQCDCEQPINGHQFGRREKWPVVRFENGEELLCQATEFTVQGYRSNVEARRQQVPLILSWAISIHKSQGQTLSRVKVDLGHAFEEGQVYVAISRATSMDGLELLNFDLHKIRVNPKVAKWHKRWSPEENWADQDPDGEFEGWVVQDHSP